MTAIKHLLGVALLAAPLAYTGWVYRHDKEFWWGVAAMLGLFAYGGAIVWLLR